MTESNKEEESGENLKTQKVSKLDSKGSKKTKFIE